MTGVSNISNWIQNVLKTSKSYSNNFYYDGHGVIRSYEKSIENDKEIISNIESKRKILEKIHKIRSETHTIFSPLYEDISRLEMEKFELELRVAHNELSRSKSTLIILKNLVGLSKITDMLMQELSQNSRSTKIVENLRKFQLNYEPTMETLKNHLDEKLRKQDAYNHKDR